jgi:FAD/FMN-containing dehydrogenase
MEIMSKIAQYLNEHILGEITASKSIRQRFSRDGSILTVMPELVMFPRVTNDIRKAARFSWQLAEKGHTLPIVVRGSGSDKTGAAIGSGLIINTTAHLNNIIHIALKDKEHFVHVQPGVNFKLLNDVLNWHGLYLPPYPESASYSTVGGAVANNSGGILSGAYGLIGEWVDRTEVVLANGDLIETTRLNKKEFSKKKGLQTFEGEIYRKLDGLIEDNQQIINDKLNDVDHDNAGYARIKEIRRRDGSFDLTPLMIGSQGTLGIMSEIVLRTEFVSSGRTVVIATVASNEVARDVADALRDIDPASLETFDGQLYKSAMVGGKVYPFAKDSADVGAVIYLMLNDFNDRARAKKLKKTLKILDKFSAVYVTSSKNTLEELDAAREVMATLLNGDDDSLSMPPLIDGSYVSGGRYEEFCVAVAELSDKFHMPLPIHRRVLDGIVFIRPILQLDKVSDKQKVFKLINDYSQLIDRMNGTFIADGGEGRVKSNASYALMDDDIKAMFTQIREIFDPYSTLNPDVKQPSDVRALVSQLRSEYSQSDFSGFVPHN